MSSSFKYDANGKSVTVRVEVDFDRAGGDEKFGIRASQDGPFTMIGDVRAAQELQDTLQEAIDRFEMARQIVNGTMAKGLEDKRARV